MLTSANCVLSANNLLWAPAQLSILVGSNNINLNLPRLQVLAIYVNPQYNPFTFENDIAVLRTASNFIFPQVPIILVAPIQLSDRIAFDTQQCSLAAWNTNTNIQQTIIVPIVNRDTCNALPTNFGRISENMICAGILTAGAGVCAINRGASLYCEGQLAGVLSSGFGCGAINMPGVYTQVRFYTPWIEEQVRRQDIPPANISPIERLP